MVTSNSDSNLTLSFTHFVTWRKSQHEYFNLYIQRGYNPLFDDPSIRIGMFVHEVAASFIREQSSLFPRTLPELYHNSLQSKGHEAFRHIFMSQPVKAMVDRIPLLLSSYGGTPAAVEKSYRFDILPGVTITGKIDLILRSNGDLSLIDWKTAPTIFESIGLHNNVQLYYLAMLHYANQKECFDRLAYFSLDSGTVETYPLGLDELRMTWSQFAKMAKEILQFHGRFDNHEPRNQK